MNEEGRTRPALFSGVKEGEKVNLYIVCLLLQVFFFCAFFFTMRGGSVEWCQEKYAFKVYF